MFRAAPSVLIALLLLAGCAGEHPGFEGGRTPKFSYTGPQNPPAKPITVDLDGSVVEVVARMVKALDGPRFGITHINQDEGLITAVFRANPEEFVDCGVLDLSSAEGETSEVALAGRQLRYQVPMRSAAPGRKNFYGFVNRELQLDGRLVMKVQSQNHTESQVTVSGDYVVTRTLRLSGKPGDPKAARRQLMDFGSGQVGRFDDGYLKCQSNGELESYLLASLGSPVVRGTDVQPLEPAVDPDAPLLTRVRNQFVNLSCAPLSARSLGGQDVVVTGFVSSEEDLERLQALVRGVEGIGDVIFRVSLTSKAFCAILDVSVPLKERNRVNRAGALVRPADAAFELVEGEYVTVDATTPQFDSYVYLFYAQQDGKVIHMLPNPKTPNNLLPANQSFRVGEDPDARRYRVIGPFGDDMVILIASTEPLFPNPRPEIEATEALARDLAAIVAATEAAGADIVADIVFVRTTPRAF